MFCVHAWPPPAHAEPSGTVIDNKQDLTFIIATKLRNLGLISDEPLRVTPVIVYVEKAKSALKCRKEEQLIFFSCVPTLMMIPGMSQIVKTAQNSFM